VVDKQLNKVDNSQMLIYHYQIAITLAALQKITQNWKQLITNTNKHYKKASMHIGYVIKN
jgi:DNA-binding transcriptional regulator YbjK